MSLILLTSATSEPVTREEVKQHLRIESTNEDALVDNFIMVARIQAENYMKRQIMTAQWRMTLEDFPSSTAVLEIPRPPLSSISTAVTVNFYKDTTIVSDNTYVASTVYTVDYQTDVARIYPIYDNEWPSCVTDGRRDAVRIDFWNGYPTRASVPEPIKVWIKMKCGQLYEQREGARTIGGRIEHEHFNGLLDPYVVIKIV